MNVYRCSLSSLAANALLVLASGFFVTLTLEAMQGASGVPLLVLRATALFPVLLLVATALRLAAVGTRRISVDSIRLLHVQLFKTYTVPTSEIRQIELRSTDEGSVDVLRVRWSGVPFYIERQSIAKFDEFLAELRRHVPASTFADVVEFTPSEG